MIYLSYKKFLVMSPRDFEYVRYEFSRDGEHWNVCVSDMSRDEDAADYEADCREVEANWDESVLPGIWFLLSLDRCFA